MLIRLVSSYEFLRSDEVIDRLTFIKWAAKTQNDNGLLIAILERMDEIRREGDVDFVLTQREEVSEPEPDNYRHKNLLGMLWQLVKDFAVDIFVCGCGQKQDYRDFQWGKLDPVRFVRVYKYLKQLDNHIYNIHEASCLEHVGKPRIMSRFFHQQSERDQVEMELEQKNADAMVDWSVLNVLFSFLAIATQIVFIVFIITEIISELGEKFDEKDVKLLVSNCVITMATITIFMGFVLENYVAANRATHVIQNLRVRRSELLGERMRRDFSLLLNLVGNGLLGYFLFWLNIPFILSADTVTDAILNSLATVFLLEIDDRIKPFQPTEHFGLGMIGWDNDMASTNMVKLAHDYLYFKKDTRISDQVEVTKIFKTFEETRDEDLRHTFSPQDYCRIYVDEWDDSLPDHRITVFRLANEQMFPCVYEEIIYKITGEGAKEFISNIMHFHRVHSDTADALSEYSRKRALRALGKRRTKSVIVTMIDSLNKKGKQYLEDMEEDGSDFDEEEIPSNDIRGGLSRRNIGVLETSGARVEQEESQEKPRNDQVEI